MNVNAVQMFNQQNFHKQLNFKGKMCINGHSYPDYIVDAAKKAFKNPRWEDEARKGTSFWDHYKAEPDDIPIRILAGIVSFGTTEVVIAGLSLLGAADNNDATINKIKNCMTDLIAIGEVKINS